MADLSSRPREQEQSIKERKRLLFEDDEDIAPVEVIKAPERKTFAEHLQTTPAAPMSTGVKALLTFLSVVVGLLLIAALLRGRSG